MNSSVSIRSFDMRFKKAVLAFLLDLLIAGFQLQCSRYAVYIFIIITLLGFQEVESVRACLQYYSSLRRNLQSRLQDRGAC